MPVQTSPRAQHRTFTIADTSSIGRALPVRDLVTGERFTIDARRGLLVLSGAGGIIDTMSMRSVGTGASDSLSIAGDSSFVLVRPATDSGRVHADVVCVAGASLHWSARIPDAPVLPVSDDTALAAARYRTSYTITRQPLALVGAEMHARRATAPSAVDWSMPFDLRFDDRLRVFYNASVTLDSVPFASPQRVISGQFPAIVLRIGTNVFVDGAWYALSVPEDLDPLELANGTVGLVLDGKGEWGDTLRAFE